MSEKEKILKLEEIMEVEEGTLKLTDKLNDFDEWDSIAILSFIAMMDSDFGKIVKGSEVKELETVQDAIAMMN